jgi:hypothetical protein
MFIGPVLVLAVLVARCIHPSQIEKPELKSEYDLAGSKAWGPIDFVSAETAYTCCCQWR